MLYIIFQQEDWNLVSEQANTRDLNMLLVPYVLVTSM